MKKISPDRADEIIKEYELKRYKDIWHYSFNKVFKRNFFLKKTKDGTINLFSNALNQFSPALVYSNDINKAIVNIKNIPIGPYDNKNEKYRHLFWYLRTTSFNDFLERKTKKSPRRAHDRFPTSKTYPIYKEKYPVVFNYSPFDFEFFVKYYNKLKLPDHLTGEEVIKLLMKNNPGLPMEWQKTATLIYDNEIVAIASLIDDGKSIFADNIGTKRTKIGFGIYLFTEIIRHACEYNYFSFDGGVSGLLSYKQKVFLDSSEVYRIIPFTSYISFWEKEFWQKIFKRLNGNGSLKT